MNLRIGKRIYPMILYVCLTRDACNWIVKVNVCFTKQTHIPYVNTLKAEVFKFLLENKGTLCLGEGRQNEGQVARWLLSVLLEAKITTWPDTSLESIWKTGNRGSSGGTLTSTWTYFYGNYSIFKSAIPGWLKLIIFIEAIEFFPGDSYVQILNLINFGGIRPVLGIGVHSLIPFWLRSMFPILGNSSQEKNVHKRRKDW